MSGKRPTANAAERKKLEDLTKKFRENNVDVACIDVKGALNLWHASNQSNGQNADESIKTIEQKVREWSLEGAWDNIRDLLQFGATWTATTFDLALLKKLAEDLQKGGSVFSKYRINNYNGTNYIIFKGSQKARSILTGTRYLVNNTKIVNLGIGKLGAAKSIAGGLKITLVLTITFRAVDTLLRDEATWHEFVGASATDIGKLAISGAASYIAAALVAGGAAVGTFAVGPLFAAVAVGILVGVTLEWADDKLGITEALIKGLREAERDFDNKVYEIKREWNWYFRSPEATVDFFKRLFGARY